MSPPIKAAGWALVKSDCQPARTIPRRCLRPAPCCRNAWPIAGWQIETTSDAPVEAGIFVDRRAGNVISIAVLTSSVIALYLRSQEIRSVQVPGGLCAT